MTELMGSNDLQGKKKINGYSSGNYRTRKVAESLIGNEREE